MTMRRLKYTGARRQSFMENEVGEVEPGGEFDVPEGDAERYLRRGDIEDVMPRPGRKPKGADDEGQPPALTFTSEQDGPLIETVSVDPAPAE